eukprot:1369141-Amphidinium_carterae.3
MPKSKEGRLTALSEPPNPAQKRKKKHVKDRQGLPTALSEPSAYARRQKKRLSDISTTATPHH